MIAQKTAFGARFARGQFQISDTFLTPTCFVLLVTTAWSTPWWGTVAVVAAIRAFFHIRLRAIAPLTFLAWGLACALRDVSSHYAASRLLTKLFSLETVGLAIDSLASRLIVYSAVSAIGFLLAVLTAGAIKSVQATVNSLVVGTSAD